MKSFHWNFTFWVGKVRSKNRLFEKRSILLHYSYFYAFMNFTIIELLIVISIIALLASMLLPVLGKTKSKAYGTKCMNNCKQLGFAFAGYHNDTDFWPGSNIGTNTWNGITYKDGYINWAQLLYIQGYLPKNCVGNQHASGNKYATLGILECPEYYKGKNVFLSEKAGTYAIFSSGYYAAYVYNACMSNGATASDEKYFGVGRFSPTSTKVGRKLSQVKYPSSTMVVGDGDYSVYSAIGSDQEKRFAKRHNNRMNILLGDGHVENVSYIVKTFYLLYSGVPHK
ncbi:MAG TPA: hypothetical protein DER70_18235 [Lentisphaeria bacterium]|nr:hypothetical protein [Lentisphaeria bacterium]